MNETRSGYTQLTESNGYTIEQATRNANRRNKNNAKKAPLLAYSGLIEQETGESVKQQIDKLNVTFEESKRKQHAYEIARIKELVACIKQVMDSDEILKHMMYFRAVFPSNFYDKVYLIEYMFKDMLLIKWPEKAWEICPHEISNRHETMARYDACPYCNKPF